MLVRERDESNANSVVIAERLWSSWGEAGNSRLIILSMQSMHPKCLGSQVGQGASWVLPGFHQVSGIIVR